MTIGRFKLGGATLLAVVVVLLGTVAAWAALRDVANRLDGDPVAEASVEIEVPIGTSTPGIVSAFTPGPDLGDLHVLLAAATSQPAEDGSDVATRGPRGSSGATFSQGTSSSSSVSVSRSSGSFSSTQSGGTRGERSGVQRSGRGSAADGRGAGGGGGGGGGGGNGGNLCDMPAMC